MLNRMKWVLGTAAVLITTQVVADVPIAQTPMAGVGASYGPNIALALSIEFPTAKQAYLGTNDFNASSKYIGYFDPDKCYVYNAGGYFEPVATADNIGANDRSCSGQFWRGTSGRSSGNLLNWLTMSAIDIFRSTLTGGNRAKGTGATAYQDGDTLTFTSLRRSRLVSNNAFTKTAVGKTFASSGWTMAVDGVNYNVVVQVCKTLPGLSAADPLKARDGREENCKAYPQSDSTVVYKPEGLIQRNGTQMRFAALSYLNDNDIARMGGVLRARMKYTGVPSHTKDGLVSMGAEWSGVDGRLVVNPDLADASSSSVTNSGVINYLNKFGDASGYKTYDIAAELYYTALRYFRNKGPVAAYTSGMTAAMKDGFPAITNWDDPLLSSCQKNFIVYIGDTNTHADVGLPGAKPSWQSGVAALHKSPTDDSAFNVSSLLAQMGTYEGVSLDLNTGSQLSPPYLAAMAWWANTNPFRSETDYADARISTFMIDTVENNNPKSQVTNTFYLAAKYGGFTDSNSNGRPDLKSEWSDETGPTSIAAYPNGVPRYFAQANNPENMRNGLENAFRVFGEAVDPSLAILASNQNEAASVSSGRYTYQSSYDPKTWSGDLIAREMTLDTSGGTVKAKSTIVWRAKTSLESQLGTTASTRKAFTLDSQTRKGVDFDSTWFGGLAATHAQKIALNNGDGHGSLRVDYLRGDQAQEADSASPAFRKRAFRLGDIVNSSPAFIPAPSGNPVGCAFAANGTPADKSAIFSRKSLIAVASNDGFLHGFDKDGVERFAYMPASIYSDLPKLTSPSYAHQYFNDGSPKSGNVCFTHNPLTGTAYTNAEAKTVVVGTTGRGGRSVYALDVTSPNSMTKNNVLWEFSHSDLGLTINDVQIVNLVGGQPAVLVSSGYNQTGTTKASLFVLYLDKKIGDAWAENVNYYRIEVPDVAGNTVTPNALGAPGGVDVNGVGYASRAYAGDMNGNLWRFELSNVPASRSVQRIFTAVDDSNVRQPIVAAPRITRHKRGGFLVLFGTGRYFASTDYTLTPQALYGVIDLNGIYLGTTLTASLLEQTLGSVQLGTNGSSEYYGSSASPLLASHNGWYMELTTNERVTSAATLRNKTEVSFTSFVPGHGECNDVGTTWVTRVDIFSGALMSIPLFDTNNDGLADLVASRYKEEVGIVPAVIQVKIGDKDYLCAMGQGDGGMICRQVNSYSTLSTRQGWTEVSLAKH